MSVNTRRIANGCAMTAALAAAIVCGPAAAQARQESGRISGRVVLAGSSEPVADARVILIVESNAPPGTPLPPPLRTSSGPDGRYVLDGIPPGRYGLSAMKPGFNTPNHALIRIQVAPGQTIADALIVLERTAVFAVSGRVLDPAGQPLPGAVVKVFQRAMMREGAMTVPTTAAAASASARGEYRIVGVPAGEYCVVAAYGAEPRGPRPSGPQQQSILAPTFFPGTRDIAAARLVSSASGEDVRGIDITMVSAPAFVVSGSVVTSDGAPLSRAAVVLIVWPTTIPARAMTGVPASRVGMADRWAAGVASGPDGAFSIAGVPPGTYRLTAASFRTVPLLLASMTLTVDANVTGLSLTASSAEPTGSAALGPPPRRVSLQGALGGETADLAFEIAEPGPLSATLIFKSTPGRPVALAGSHLNDSIQLSSEDISISGTFDGRALVGTCTTPKGTGPCRFEIR
jgi:hypothetical protein